ncbi:non-ribosomal peptide synthetase, partial [Aquimarina algiphila]|uniref:non-ribosomal peptide synthetase n=2 Tax=Aquimarina algiphila TaxID=2047982 RepID=UPI0024905897
MNELLKKIDNEGVIIEVVEGELKLFSSKTYMDDDLLLEIKKYKKELTDYLNKNKNSKIEEKKYFEIPVCAESKGYQLSNAQYRLWVASQLQENSVAYNISNQIILDGAYDVDCFQKAVYAIIDRHEILRTVCKSNDDHVKQYVLTTEELDFSIDYKDFREEKNPEITSRTYVIKDSYKPFDLAKGPLIRASLLRLSEDRYLFYYNMHHIISDGWSMEVLSRDVLTYYEAYVSNTEPNLSPLRIQYKDYAAWQLSELDSPSFLEHKEYWLSQFSKEIPVIDLPSQKRRPQILTYKGRRVGAHVSREATRQLRKFTTENGGSLFMALLTVWKVLLYRYTGETDVTVGNPVAGRNHADLENQIGFYINTLALRNQITPTYSFIELYNEIKASTLEAFAHQMYPFDKLIEDLNIQRDISRNPLFDVLIDYNGISDTGINFDDVNELQDLGVAKVKFDLELDLTEVSGGINLQLGYNTDVYDQEMVEGLLVHYKRLLTLFLENPERCIGTVTFLSDKESTRLLNEFNTFQIGDSQSYNIVDLFSSQCHKTPDATAVVFEAESLTYKELDERSNQLAHYLQNCGVIRDTLVPICVSSSLDSIVGMLGIIKSGGVYVPIDQDCPQQRLDFILEDTGCKQLLSHSDLSSIFEEYEEDIELIYMDSLDVLEDFSVLPLDISIDPSQLLYVIYTSGTTGVPKGVLIEHKSLAYYILCQTQYFGIEPDDTFVLLANTAFDASIEQMFLAILNGGKLVIPKKSDILDNESFL